MNILVIGCGKFGSVVAAGVSEKNPVTVIDKDETKLEEIRDKVNEAIIADVLHPGILEKFVRNKDTVIVSLGNEVESSVLITNKLKDLGVKRIIAKASTVVQGEILERLGAHQVVVPERDEALHLASDLNSPDEK